MKPTTNPARSGNAIVLAIGVMAISAAIIVSTTDSMVVSVGNVRRHVDHNEITAAVSTTLVRRERMLSQAATLGAEGFVRRFDPAYDYDLDTVGFVGGENYGVDYVGGVQVRWRIQPVKAREDGIWKQNPRADGEGAAIELPNSFLFRVEAEGRLPGANGESRAVVQGVRYSAINKEPLFRYIIFYSQDGAKGDIEFAHGPEFSAKGSVHTNGSIFLGGAAITASWDALNSGLMSATLLGPYQDPYGGPSAPTTPVLVNAYDGIFRLSKQVLFNRANNFPIAGTAPAGFASDWYATGGSYPGESGSVTHYRAPSGSTVLAATFGGTEVNPNRVIDGRGLATTETGDTKRQINGTAVRGVDEGTYRANDSRDRSRPATTGLKWATDSLGPAPDGFEKHARSSDNGGRIVRLPGILGNRAFEAQKLQYDDVDADPTTDNHEYARPLFLTSSGETPTHPDAAGPVVEAPGSYLSFALGSSDLALTRAFRSGAATSTAISTGYNAWTVTDKSGAATTTSPESMGLIIRERMEPDLNYLSSTASSSAGPDYIPYAYGKHMRSTRWPYWAIDVAAGFGSDADIGQRGNAGYIQAVYGDWGQINSTKSKQTYIDGGTLNAAAAADESFGAYDDNLSGLTGTNARQPKFYRSNWRMFHLQRPVPDETKQGLLATAYNDFDPTKPWLPRSGYLGPFGGVAVKRGLFASGINQNNFSSFLSGSAAAASDPSHFAIRWTGFVKPPVSGAYTFYFSTDDGGRLWVNDVRMADQWRPQGTTVNGGGEQTTIVLEKDIWYPIVAEMYEIAGGDEARLEWSAEGLAREVIPGSRCAPPKGANGGAFNKDDWKAVQGKLTSTATTSIPANGKVGLMVRPQPHRVQFITIVREAEDASLKASGTEATPTSWADTPTADSDASGGRYMQASPTAGTIADTATPFGYTGATLDFNIAFPATGTYFVWLRMKGGTDDNSVHVRVAPPWANTTFATATNGNRIEKLDSTSVLNSATAWRWVNRASKDSAVASIAIPSIGTYKVRVQMAENGVCVDQLMLTNQSGLNIPFPGHTTVVLDSSGQVSSGNILVGSYVDAGSPSGLPVIANGADPYLALCYSPTRGIFAEFRGERAASEGRNPSRFFTGTSDATDTYGEQTVSVGDSTRQGVLTPSQVTNNSDSLSTFTKYDKGQRGSSSQPPTDDLQVSEFKFDNVRKGAWTRSLTSWPTITVSRTVTTAWRFTLGSTDYPTTQQFIVSGNNTDWDKNLNFYAANTGVSQAGLTPAVFNMNTGSTPSITNWTGTQFDATWTSSATPVTVDWGNTAGFTNGAVTNIASKTIGDTIFTNIPLTTTVVADTSVTKTWTFGDDNTYWYVNDDPPKYDGTTTAVDYAVFKAKILALNASAKIVRLTSGTAPSAPDTFSIPYKADPPSNYLTAPANPAAWNNGTAPLTFSLDRTSYIMFDQNSYVSRFGTWWFDAARPMSVLPWNTALWKAITAPPVTSSFSPDRWNYTRSAVTDPAYWPRRSGITANGADTTTDIGGALIGSPRWSSDLPAAWPPADGLPASTWLRIERSTGNEITMSYAFTDTAPTASDWQPVTILNGAIASWPIDSWSSDLLIGPCLQSGSKNDTASTTFSDLTVEFYNDQAAPEIAAVDANAKTLSYFDWENITSTNPAAMSRYMAGQYQVFFGPYEITEDFFTWQNATGQMVSTENWIYQLREFWSQSPWWNTYVSGTPTAAHEKDPGNQLPATMTPSVRELLARSTLLNLDMAVLQDYLKNRSLADAVVSRMSNAGPTTTPTTPTGTLASRFNGLIYAARSNRYPWNPNTQGANPWNVALPNDTSSSAESNEDLMAMAATARAAAFTSLAGSMATANQTGLHTGTAVIEQHLQPYTDLIGDQAPAFKPTQFHHGVRILNGASIDWAFDGTAKLFGTGKTAIMTPNLLYVQGNFNTTQQLVTKNNVPNTPSYVPAALIGDQVNFLSGNWNDTDWKSPGITVDANGLTSTSLDAKTALTRGWQSSHPLPAASSTSVVAAVITHNQPTTRESVRVGEAASIISTMLYLENWAGRTFNYTGSLVVMDSRRYTNSYQLDSSKDFGPSPFGYIKSSWRTALGLTATGTGWGAAGSTTNKIPSVYVAPSRTFTFNPDLLTPQGTPPFAPFGTSARGVGGWIRIIR